MKLKEARIFLSYTHKDEDEVLKLYRRLKEAGYNPWIDSEDIMGGEDWEKATKKAIEEAALFLPCITHNSITHRGMVQSELNFALKVWEKKLESDIYLIPVRLEDCPIPGSVAKFHCINLFKENGFQRLINSIEAAFERLEVTPKIRLRSEPMDKLSGVTEMLRANDFYHVTWNPAGKGIHHEYELQTIKGDEVIIEHTTGLMWQQGGSTKDMLYKPVEGYIAEMNNRKFAGFDDWRLPTLEEAMSLMEPKRSNNRLYINPVFHATQIWIWTADRDSASSVWVVYFNVGGCSLVGVDFSNLYVRAVRSH